MNSKKQKVLIFLPEFPVLTETFIEREISELVKRDNLDITLTAIKQGQGTTSEAVTARSAYLHLTKGAVVFGFFKYGFMQPIRFFKTFKQILGNDRVPFLFPFFIDVIEDKTTLFDKLMLTRFVLFIKSFGYAYIISTFNPDHLWVHFGASPSTLIMCVSTLLDVPYSMSFHAKDVVVNGSLLPSKLQTVKHVFICNKYVYDYLLNNYPDFSKKLHLQYHGVDFNEYDSYIPRSMTSSKPMLLNISRLVEKKGQKYLIEAAAKLKEKGYSFLLYIIGPGPLYNELQNQILLYDLQDFVSILGDGKGLPFAEVKDILSLADIFVFPAIKAENEDIDGVPNGVIEAAAFKKACIVTDAGSVTELIKHEETGIIISQKNVDELVEALSNLLNDPALRNKYGNNAYMLAKSLFDLTKNVKFYEEKFL